MAVIVFSYPELSNAASLKVQGVNEAVQSGMDKFQQEVHTKQEEFAREAQNNPGLAREQQKDQVHKYSERSCAAVIGNSSAYMVCTGNCGGAGDNYEAYEACDGNCGGIDSSKHFGAYQACQGTCSGLSNVETMLACESCGGGPVWASMYLLGATVRCYR
jgi:hypothetical protein